MAEKRTSADVPDTPGDAAAGKRAATEEDVNLTANPGGTAAPAEGAAAAAKPPRRKKLPYAVCIGYVGTGYQGLQWQDGLPTIEGDLWKAIHLAGGISDENMQRGGSGLNPLSKVGWMRASRTDKGVHAVMNVISLKLQDPEDPSAFVEEVNRHLPEQIRVYRITRVIGSFNPKNAVSHRHYSYILPTFAFLEDFSQYFDASTAELELAPPPPQAPRQQRDKAEGGAAQGAAAAPAPSGLAVKAEEDSAFDGGDDDDDGDTGAPEVGPDGWRKRGKAAWGKKSRTKGKGGKGGGGAAAPTPTPAAAAAAATPSPEGGQAAAGDAAGATAGTSGLKKVKNSDVAAVGEYTEIPDEIFEKLRAYHMSDKVREEVNAILAEFVGTHYFQNYTREKEPGDPSAQRYITEFRIESVEMSEGIEVASITVKGAAFMMHQIRRMVGMAIAVYNARLGIGYLRESISKEHRQSVPTAPPTGLLLCRLVHGFYHKRLENIRKSRQQSGTEHLEELDYSAEEPRMLSVFQSIRAEVMRQELSGRVMACWLRTIPHIVNRYLRMDMYQRLAELKAAKGEEKAEGTPTGVPPEGGKEPGVEAAAAPEVLEQKKS